MDEHKQLDYRGLEPVVTTTTHPARGKRDSGMVVTVRIIGDPLGLIEGHPTIKRRDDGKPARGPLVPPGTK